MKNIKSLVENVIDQIRKNGDKALINLINKYDRIKLTTRQLKISPKSIQGAKKRIPTDLRQAMEQCARRIQEFHWHEKKHLCQSWIVSKEGVRYGQIYNPIDVVGIYVPGGRFSYPSTLLMTAIPAKMAGVKRIVVTTPPGRLAIEICAAADIVGIQEIYQVGGPAAIAALALGTKTIPRVNLIVGPGNALVTEAKRQLFGEVGIDLLAGPSELVVLADESGEPDFIAADLCAQAEHDPEARGILVSTSKSLITEVRKKILKEYGKQCQLIFKSTLQSAIDTVNDFASEHVEVCLKRPQGALDRLKNGGTIFLQNWSPTAMGDYWAGPSHVLPTRGAARYASGLSVMSFLKRSSLVEISTAAYKKGWKAAHTMAVSEGLIQHARSLSIRQKESSL